MDDTHLTLLLGGLAIITAAGLVSLNTIAQGPDDPAEPPKTVQLTESFEDNPGRWHEHGDVPEDPKSDGNVDWSITPTQRYASDGNTSMLYQIDGNQDDGTIWLQTNMSIEPGHRYNVTMKADAWSQSKSFNKLAQIVMLAGEDLPESETDFPQSNTRWTDASRTAGGLRADLDEQEGWKTYSFSWQTPEIQQDHLVVAVGISVVWETQLAYPLDTVHVEATPLGQ